MLTKASQLGSRLKANRIFDPVHRISSNSKPLQKSQKRFFSDHYATLGVSPTATQAEIKKAFFEKAKKFHPDVNNGDPNAQKKFVEISAAYEVLKDKTKRDQYDMERQYGGGFGGGGFGGSGGYGGGGGGYGGAGGYQQQQQQQQQYYQNQGSTGYNPYRSGNPYYRSRPDHASSEEFMKWYRSQFGDAFREFDEFNRGQTTIIEERMPDGSIRIRIIQKGRPGGQTNASSGGASSYQEFARRQRPSPGAQPSPEDIFRTLFGKGGMGSMFGSMFGQGFRNGQNFESGGKFSESATIHGTSVELPPYFNVVELHNERSDGLEFSISAGGSSLGTLSERILSGSQGSVLTFKQQSQVVAKSRRYFKDGVERMIIENGSSKRVATVERTREPPPPSDVVGPLQFISDRFSLHYKILDERDILSGYCSVSPWRRKFRYFDTAGNEVAFNERVDMEVADIQKPTLDVWNITISDLRQFDPSVYLFTTAFSTLAERQSKYPLPGLQSLVRAILHK